ncbi:unnamed protein product [Owenia fusiformis]|uniref:VWFA domain-containing protein n=1 Tax=Owenia fusiformis TaxID=6347 RepID=A0A8S4PG09_OWEFU|nr:unnamed protein product [Owenia fusiformis]
MCLFKRKLRMRMEVFAVFSGILTLLLQVHAVYGGSFGAMLFGRLHSSGNRQPISTFGDDIGRRGGCNPSIYGHEKYSSVTYQGEVYRCAYYECKAEIVASLIQWKYRLKFCPDGQGVTSELISKGTIGGRPPPCERNNACKKTLAEKGIRNASSPICRVDLVLLLDTCTLGSSEKRKVQTFVLNLISAFSIGPSASKLAIVSYEYDLDELLSFGSAEDERTAKILFDNSFNIEDTSLKCGNESWEVLKYAYENLFFGEDIYNRQDIEDTIVLISDETSIGNDEATFWADKLKSNGVNILAVHLTNTTRQGEKVLREYASDSLNGYWSVPDIGSFGSILFGRNFSSSRPVSTFGDYPDHVKRKGCNPSIFGHGKYSSVTYQGEVYKCAYYECKAEIVANLRRWKYRLKFCPDGQGVTSKLISRGTIGGRTPPCQGNNACQQTLAEKGLRSASSPICRMDLVVLLDTCTLGSIDKKRVQTFVLNLISAFSIGPSATKLAILSYEDDLDELLSFGSAEDERTAKILFDNNFNTENTSLKCGTGLWKVFKYAYENLLFAKDNNNREDNEDTVILISDGTSIGNDEAKSWADKLKADGVNILVVHLANTTRNAEKLLREYASDSMNGYWSVPYTDQIGEIEDETVARICSKR